MLASTGMGHSLHPSRSDGRSGHIHHLILTIHDSTREQCLQDICFALTYVCRPDDPLATRHKQDRDP